MQSLSIDQKWAGAPFAAMLRRHQSGYSNKNDNILHIVFVLLSSSSNVKQVKYSSVVLQPLDLNLDEETLMRLVPFWRTSLSESNTKSQQYYFDHFEIHPIKIIASFLPGDSYSSYSSAQEMLRYAMRAIYLVKGSPLLPPAFASIFDDLASSSLDVFFDPSSVLINLPGLTIGTFKFISKCIGGKGFSGSKRYLGDLGKTMKTAGSNILFAAVTEISDSVLKGAEASGFNGMVSGFHQGILKLAMEPSVLGAAFMEGGPDRKIVLDRSPGIDEVFLKNLPPNSSLIEEIMDRVKGFLVSKALLKGDSSTTSQPLRHLRGDSEFFFNLAMEESSETSAGSQPQIERGSGGIVGEAGRSGQLGGRNYGGRGGGSRAHHTEIVDSTTTSDLTPSSSESFSSAEMETLRCFMSRLDTSTGASSSLLIQVI
ncbi:vacuolar protein sorting-associated protein, putative [Actinidia rufa]|uniref:Vacuolar protein sorting-associated protein, putative n=1 Tax=Actinidia rufa TaxID=165716 RepID=A0A7J0F5D1_9ERIC|nr:vacuolar protein sorting-associated protein, putative [Actinidia rufa]